jgi:guanylate kinase
MTPATKRPRPTSLLLVLAGPAGSGKTTLCGRLVAGEPGFSRVVTATTRPPREGERNDVHYHFLSPEEFDAKLAAGEFLEWARVHGVHRYGTLKQAVLGPLSEEKNLVINIDVQGVEAFIQAARSNEVLHRHMVTVFIDVAEPELRRRLALRGSDGPEEIERRMRTAIAEISKKHLFDHVIDSGTRGEDYEALRRILPLARRRVLELSHDPSPGLSPDGNHGARR